jgi:hypothetical protein
VGPLSSARAEKNDQLDGLMFGIWFLVFDIGYCFADYRPKEIVDNLKSRKEGWTAERVMKAYVSLGMSRVFGGGMAVLTCYRWTGLHDWLHGPGDQLEGGLIDTRDEGDQSGE